MGVGWAEKVMSHTVEKYYQWYTLIVLDNVELLTAILEQEDITMEERHLLLNGKFSFGPSNNRINGYKHYPIKTPLCIAAISKSINVLQELIRNGGDICGKDINDYNILHCIVGLSVYFPDQEEDMVEVYKTLTSVLGQEKLRYLHKMEENYGYRPLEFAAKQGCFRLMMSFFDTEGVYLVKTNLSHGFVYKYYDITDYETNDSERTKRSPLVHMIYMAKDKVNDNFTLNMFKENSLIHNWIGQKRKMNILLIFLWFIARMLFFIIYFVYDTDEDWVVAKNGIASDIAEPGFTSNATHFVYCANFTPFYSPSESIHMSRWYVLVTYCIAACTTDFAEIVMFFKNFRYFRNLNKTLKGQKTRVTVTKWYRISNTWTVNLILMSAFIHNTKNGEAITDFIRIIVTLFGIWSPLYFIQLLPHIGYFVATIQRMMGNLFQFLVIFVIILFPFSQMLLVFVNANSKQGCVEEFSTFTRSVYSVLLVMQNMLNLSDFDVEKRYVIMILHVALILALPIVLINFLIAIMSSSVQTMVELEEVVSELMFLQMTDVVERRFRYILRPYYRWMVNRHYCTEGGRVFIVTTEPISKHNDGRKELLSKHYA